jgi:PadR family transcriptional regulator PadR
MELGDTQLPLPQLRRGVLELCVLALLDRQQEAYAFDIVRQLSAAEMVISEGTVYPLLTRLRSSGLVSTRWSESTTGPPRRYYSLTPRGITALAGFRIDWQRFRSSVDRLLEEPT